MVHERILEFHDALDQMHAFLSPAIRNFLVRSTLLHVIEQLKIEPAVWKVFKLEREALKPEP
eukprot:2624381-Rhodomonas_salina.1